MFHKCISYRRQQRAKAIKHKTNIYCKIFGATGGKFLSKPGILSKGKVHCSCPLCSAKSKQDRGVHNKSVQTYTFSDRRKFSEIKSQLTEMWEAL